MKRHLVLLAWCAAIAPLVTAPLVAQESREMTPQLSFKVVEDFFKIPDNMLMAEATGVALNSKGHIFILNRGNHPLLEFGPDGSFISSLGEGSPIFHAAHSVRFDSEDNMWLVDAANNLVVKLNQQRRVVQALFFFCTLVSILLKELHQHQPPGILFNVTL